MSCDSSVSLWTARRRFKWLWLLVPVVVALSSLQSYVVLQLLSGMLLFTLLFAILAALAALFAMLVVAAHYVLDWMGVAIASIAHSFQSSVSGTARLSMRPSSSSGTVPGRTAGHQRLV